jgi:hypothetical protein
MPSDNFIELIIAKLRIALAEIRPGMNVVDHQLQIVAVAITNFAFFIAVGPQR